MKDGMKVEFTKNTDMWIADWHYVDDLCFDYPVGHQLPIELQYRKGHNANARAIALGYTPEKGSRYPAIPAFTVGKIRRYISYHVSIPLELPSWIVQKSLEGDARYDALVDAYYSRNGRTRTVEIVRWFRDEPPIKYPIIYEAHWWAIYIQMWPVEKYFESTERHRRKYFRGIGLVNNNKWNDNVPEYLEPIGD